MSPGPVLRIAADPAEFFERAWDHLVADEARHNLILGMAGGLISGDHDYEAPIFLATVEDAGRVVGHAFRTPPFKVGVSDLPPEVDVALVDALAERWDALPAVMGPSDTAYRIASAWAERTGTEVVQGMRMRIHRATAVAGDLAIPEGRFRRAVPADAECCIRWLTEFLDETGVQGGGARPGILRMIEAEALFVWELDGDLVSMAAASGATPHGIRIAYVYTPHEHRRRGFATATVATLTANLLRSGRRVVFLYTDLANPTSNRIYARIGFEGVADVGDWSLQ